MKLLKLLSAAALVVLIGTMGCEQSSPSSADSADPAMAGDVRSMIMANGSTASTVDLIAAKSVDVGDVTFDDVDTDNDGMDDALQVTYTTADGWTLMSTQLWVGPSLADMPDNRVGDPKPRKFPYHDRKINETTWTLTVPFEAIGYQCGDVSPWYVAARAVVRKVSGHKKHRTEDAWSGDTRFRDKRGHWASYTTIVIDCDQNEEPPVVVTETSYSHNPEISFLCFSQFYYYVGETPIQLSPVSGWLSVVPAYGTYQFTLYADPNNNISCDATSGVEVGTASVTYNEGVATVTVNAATGYNLYNVYVHFGLTPAPMVDGVFSIDPSAFGFQATGLQNATTMEATILGVSGPDPAYLIVRADVIVVE